MSQVSNIQYFSHWKSPCGKDFSTHRLLSGSMRKEPRRWERREGKQKVIR